MAAKTTVKVTVTLTSDIPLIINRFHEKPEVKLPPDGEAEDRLYKESDGSLYIPSENFRQSFIAAASRHKIGRRAATTEVAAGVYAFPEHLPLDSEWHVDSRAVVIPATRGRIMAHRPMFNDWSVTLELLIDTRLISVDLVHRIIEDSGSLVGVGDFRPSRKGQYGRYSITEWQVVKESVAV